MQPQINTDDLFRDVHATVVEGGQCLRYWRVFNDPNSPKEYGHVLSAYPLFFWTTRVALLTTAIIDLCKMHDPKAPAASLPALHSRLSGQPGADPSKISQAANLIAKASPVYKRVRVLRNKVFAHRDSRGDPDYWFKLASISPNALFELHAMSEEALNCLSYARDRSSYASLKLHEPSDFQQLLGDIIAMWGRAA